MNLKSTETRCDRESEKKEDLVARLHHAQKTALDDTATALKSIVSQQKMAQASNAPNQGNVMDAKKDVIDAMVNLAIASSEDGMAGVRTILAGYGLEDMV